VLGEAYLISSLPMEPTDPAVVAREVATALRAGSAVIALTGAGASVESGIAPYRAPGVTGWMWSGLALVGYPIAGCGHAWDNWPRVAYFFYSRFFRASVRAATPNACHTFLADIGASVVTTNVDDLHERAGPTDYADYVAAVHGTVSAEICAGCGRGAAACAHSHAACGYPRPAVLLFGDRLYPDTAAAAVRRAEYLVDRAKASDTPLVFVVGVSWALPTFAQFLAELRTCGGRIIHVNVAPPPAEYSAPNDVFVRESAAAFFKRCREKYHMR